PNAAGGFKRRVADLLSMDEHDVQAMVLLGVPTCCIDEAGHTGKPSRRLPIYIERAHARIRRWTQLTVNEMPSPQ
ncbi:MAG: hypothetical protein ACPH3H_02565, partial [Pseudomonadales bacterium]